MERILRFCSRAKSTKIISFPGERLVARAAARVVSTSMGRRLNAARSARRAGIASAGGLAPVLVVVACAVGSASVGCAPTEPVPAVSSVVAAMESEVDDVVDLYIVLRGPSASAAVGRAASSGSPAAVRRTRQRLSELAVLRDTVRPHLLGLGATVITELSRLANAFQVRMPRAAIAKIQALPEVAGIEPVPLLFRTLHSSLPVVGAPLAWVAATPVHGDGIKLGIMDTGIDYLHADFGELGNPDKFGKNDATNVEPGTFPTKRVAGGFDFAGDPYNPNGGVNTPSPDDDPIDCGGHGSHVAGIAAGGGVLIDGQPYIGPYDMSFDISQFRVAPGVAPRASLYSLKVFGCDGSTRLIAAALEWASDPDDDGDFSDRLDVVNASLGSPYGIPNPINQAMIQNFHTLGGLFVAAAGNEGGTFFVTGSPANYAPSLSVAASIDTSLLALRVDLPAGVAGDYASAEATFTAPLRDSGPVSGELVYTQPPLACSPLDNASDLAGKVALIDRGGCSFQDKLSNVVDAGALGAIVVNNTFANPFRMSASAGGGSVDIPAVMIRFVDGEVLKQALVGEVNVTLTRDPYRGDGAELMAGLSSRGPSSFDGKLKPEITAPGVAIESANVGSGFQATSKQGTSMATPFVAGAAALVRQARPSMTPSDVKAVLINSAAPMFNGDGEPYPISMQGAGRLDVLRAVEQYVTASVGDSDGTVAITFEPLVSATAATTESTLLVTNHGDVSVSYVASALQAHALDGVIVTVTPVELTVAPGSTEQVTVTLSLDPFELADPAADPVTPLTQVSLPRHFLDEADGHIVFQDIGDSDQSLVLPFYGVVRAASDLVAAPASGCVLEGGEVVAVTLFGDSAHPSPQISAFELGALDPVDLDIQPKKYDIRAFGVATDAAVTPRFEEVLLHFAVAVEGQWTTPTLGARSIVGITIDVDRDGSPEYSVRLEPLNAEDPFYDVLAASVYELESGAQIGSKRYVNMRAANEADTSPFYNSVIVLSAFASDIGLSEDDTVFDYAAFSESPLGLVQLTEPATFDISRPGVDPARSAPDAGVPLYGPGDSIVAHLGERGEDGTLPSLLLLHHNGMRGARFETVDVSSYAPVSLDLTHSFSETTAAGDRVTGKIEVKNTGEVLIEDVTVFGKVRDATLALLAPSHGTCDDGLSVRCELGSIPPGATRKITVFLTGSDAASSVGLDLSVRSRAGCELPLAVSVAIVERKNQPPLYDAGGGCVCSMVRRGTSLRARSWLLLAVAGAAAGLRQRKRRRSPGACASS